MKRSGSVEDYISSADQFQDALLILRRLLLQSGMAETVKWGAPCYVLNGQNVVGLACFKSYVGLWFHQGALMADPEGVFVSGGESTKAMRQWRFTDAGEIDPQLVTSYLREAAALAAAGKSIKAERSKPLDVPEELSAALAGNTAAAAAWRGFGKGKQREYCEHVASAKRDATRSSRLDKIMPMIAAGIGLNDKYRS